MSSLIPQVPESELPADQRRIRLPAQSLADGGAVQRTSGPTWRQQVEIAVLVVVAPPGVIALAYVVASAAVSIAEFCGATFLAN